MSIPKEILEQYAVSARPYLESECAVDWSKYLHMRSWRYVFEINSACNLKCALCHAGNRAGYQYHPGIMNADLMERCLDKIVNENNQATVCAYVNSEPFLHPRLAQCVAAIKRRGLKCEIASNFNIWGDVQGLLDQHPDLFTVSVSGWSQPVYERAHRGGNIEVVKENLYRLAQIVQATGYKGFVGISYHVYKDNMGDEMEQMRVFAKNLGFKFMRSYGRAITMENAVQACREMERRRTGVIRPYQIGKDDLDLNLLLPPVSDDFLDSLERVHFHPAQAQPLYERWPVAPVCLIADLFTEIRHDGRVQLCAWTDDTRLTLGNFLEMSQDDIREARIGHPLCQECLRYRLNLYFHIVDRQQLKTLTGEHGCQID